MVLILLIALVYQGVFSVNGVQGVYGVMLHFLYYCTIGCSFNCLSMSLIIYITAPYSAHTTGCLSSIWCWLKNDFLVIA